MSVSSAIRTPSLPTETLDQIFGYAGGSHEGNRIGRKNLKSFSLACRSWRSPAERLLFAEIKLRSFGQLKRLENLLTDKAELRKYVKHLQVTAMRDSDSILDALPALLRLTTNLSSLVLEMSPMRDDYAPLPVLETLNELQITFVQVDTRINLFHRFITLAPNMSSLSLASRRQMAACSTLDPITLPFLHNLSLKGVLFSSQFEKTKLLAHETLRQIDTLSFDGLGQWEDFEIGSALTFTELVGPQITTLELCHSSSIVINHESVVAACSNLNKLVIHGTQLPPHLPPSLKILRFEQPGGQCSEVDLHNLHYTLLTRMDEDILSNRGLRLETPHAQLGRKVLFACQMKGVDVVSKGVFYPANRAA